MYDPPTKGVFNSVEGIKIYPSISSTQYIPGYRGSPMQKYQKFKEKI